MQKATTPPISVSTLVYVFTLTRGAGLAVIYAWFSSLEWVSVDRQTKHSQCILNERRHLSFNLNFRSAVKGSRTSAMPWASGGQVRWAQTLPCSICDEGQRLGNNNKTTFFSKRSVAMSDIPQSCIFHIHFTEHLIWNLLPPSGFESVLFFNASLPLLFSWRWFYNGSLWHSVAVSSTTAFISPFLSVLE